MKDKIVEGTTTVGITCKDGIVFATERRATMGNLVAHKVAEKIFKIDDHIATTIAGSVGDAQSLMKVIGAETSLYQMRNNDEISVKAAASLTANILRSGPMYVQILLGGMDEDEPSIYSLDPAGGMIKDNYISTGSGSIVAYGVLEDRFRDDLSVDEGLELAIRAIRAAAERDTYSGNGFLVAKVDKDGFEMLDNEKVKEILDKI
ncbi:proteasome beta subunit [Methanobrevibacter gottschalkii]|uniref:Proteasome subunit beta n=2 Tax=Methanobrevibacter gottschalkii TaxID=190974 RepID=A0A3N5BSC2_9EURY|nr:MULTISPECIES: archaeal proteasome endopeptidase complex subunit beta [Methanobrevibacter]MCQ2970153.1 archaeal proteasome endopeptidase complex subunit beta [archaeon]OEC93798.1 proteasome endopeptidase complex, archaeal, beta subunit [Methanobrevibacter sp. A27]RPF52638.1 proteasome beta subunit [Methanobrevibacter gottschalkii DSM 11977]SEK30241.1 proteasome beta subunit [Methanobrevibacter gottschalkii]